MDTAESRKKLGLIRDTVTAARADRNAQRDRSIRLIPESGTLICDQVVQRLLNALASNAILQNYADLEGEARNSGDAALLDELEIARAEAAQSLQKPEAQMRTELGEYANLAEGLGDDYSLPLLKRHAAFVAGDVDARGPRRAACLDALEDHLEIRAMDGFVNADTLEGDLREIAIERGSDQ